MTVSPILSHLLDDAVSQHPDKLAIACRSVTLTYKELQTQAQCLATAFIDAGLAGEQVAILLPNSAELIICYLACWLAGVKIVPFEYVDAPPEVQYGLADSRARWLIVHEEKISILEKIDRAHTSIEMIFIVGKPIANHSDFSELLSVAPRQLSEIDPGVIAFILYTSGSTALPKGVTHSHSTASGIINSVIDALRCIDSEALIVVHDSVSHMGGWIEVFPFLWRGATIVLEKDFDVVTFFNNLQHWRPTVVGAHVEHLWQMVRYKDLQQNDFSSVKCVFTGGEELPLALQRAFIERTRLPIQVGWGMTEAIWLTIARKAELVHRGYMGEAVNQVNIRIVDPKTQANVQNGNVGEFWVKGPMVTPGYWRRPQANREVLVEGGWLRTGDMGFRDKEGKYWFTGRLKQIIERHGENITPGEIEQALYRLPEIAEAYAFGIPDRDAGQVPIAFVSLKPGMTTDEKKIKNLLATQIASYKIPERIFLIKEMPLTYSGKIDHQALLGMYKKTQN